MLGAVNVSLRPVNSSISSACCASSRRSMITFHCDAGVSFSPAAGGSLPRGKPAGGLDVALQQRVELGIVEPSPSS